MPWRASTTFRIVGLGFLVLGAVFPGGPYLLIGAGLLVIGWILLIRERRARRGSRFGG
jgi:membrane-bound ClpP family serine protease